MRQNTGLLCGALTLLLLALVPFQARAADEKACGALQAVSATHTFPPYPQWAIMAGLRGTLVLQVSVGGDGKVADASVQQSTGSDRLDYEAVQYVKANYLWNSESVDCRQHLRATQVKIIYELAEDISFVPPGVVLLTPGLTEYPRDALAAHKQGKTTIVVVLSDRGTVAQTSIARSSGSDSLDQKAKEIVLSHQWKTGQMDGEQVSTVFDVIVLWQMPH